MLRRFPFAALLLSVACAFALTASPAHADPHVALHAPGPPVVLDITTGAVISGPTAGTSPTGSAIHLTVVDCIAQFNPTPMYSTSGGTFGTVHWGGKVSCVGTPGVLVSVVQLYSIQGNGDFQHNVPEAKHTLTATGLLVGGTWFTPCLGRTSSRWIASISSTYDSDPFTPSTGWSTPVTLACTAG